MKIRKLAAASIILLSTGWAATAENVTSGRVVGTFADPNDFVIELDTAGRCGSKWFHIQRAKPNFKEMAAVAMTALASNKKLMLFVERCVQDRNILSHGAAMS